MNRMEQDFTPDDLQDVDSGSGTVPPDQYSKNSVSPGDRCTTGQYANASNAPGGRSRGDNSSADSTYVSGENGHLIKTPSATLLLGHGHEDKNGFLSMRTSSSRLHEKRSEVLPLGRDSQSGNRPEVPLLGRDSQSGKRPEVLPLGRDSQSGNRPEVLLLGRGNSFSLGRSEVILLHKRPVRKSKSKGKKQGDHDQRNLASIHEQISDVPSSPPLISKIISPHGSNEIGPETPESLYGQTDSENDESGNVANDLNDLWSKAEELMVARQAGVLNVLEEFGIGELGQGGGDESGQLEEEEHVWRIVQENMCGQH